MNGLRKIHLLHAFILSLSAECVCVCVCVCTDLDREGRGQRKGNGHDKSQTLSGTELREITAGQ